MKTSENGRNPVPRSDKQVYELRHVTFDPESPAIQTTWSSNAKTVVAINPYPNGITFSIHQAKDENTEEEGKASFAPGQFHLRLSETKDYQLPTGKYFLYKENFADALEYQLSQLRKSNLLSSTVLYFGMTNDPFLSFHKKFDVTMKCLELLEQYRPGFVVVQTRSPMVISTLPALKSFADRLVVAIPIESPLEQVIQRYSPGQPRISERIIAADGLRQQGVKVNLLASPILPYGDFYRDAWGFAELLVGHSDYITFGCLASGSPSDELQLRTLPIAKKLEADQNFRWLRPHAYRYLYFAVESLAKEKLVLPVQDILPKPNQLSLFAA